MIIIKYKVEGEFHKRVDSIATKGREVRARVVFNSSTNTVLLKKKTQARETWAVSIIVLRCSMCNKCNVFRPRREELLFAMMGLRLAMYR
jgi:predicted metal-binding protein